MTSTINLKCSPFWMLSLLISCLCFAESSVQHSDNEFKPLKIQHQISLARLFSFDSHQLAKSPAKVEQKDSAVSLQLVGTLIFAELKIAWIKTDNNIIHEVSPGDTVPGSDFEIEKIYSDAVQMKKLAGCELTLPCTMRLTLDR